MNNGIEKFIRSWVEGKSDLAPVVNFFQIKPLNFEAGKVVIEMPVDSRFHNPFGIVHGGIFCDFADVAMGAAFASTLDEGEIFSTVELQMNYFKSIVDDIITAKAYVVRKGKKTGYVECEIFDPRKNLIAKGNSSCLVLRAD